MVIVAVHHYKSKLCLIVKWRTQINFSSDIQQLSVAVSITVWLLLLLGFCFFREKKKSRKYPNCRIIACVHEGIGSELGSRVVILHVCNVHGPNLL